MIKRVVGGLLSAAFVLAPFASAQAINFPVNNKPIHLVVTFPPGGGTDLLARKLGDALEKQWQSPVVVENRPGASGNIGARYVSDSQTDGHTLLMVNSSFAINPGVYTELGFDPKADFEPVINVAWVPSVIVVGRDNEATTLEHALEPVAGQSNVAFASCGNGTPQHLAGEMLAESSAKELLHIPYRGCGPAVADVVSGQVPMGIVTIPSAMSFIENGQLRALAVTSTETSSALPGVPAVNEAMGLENYELNQWHGVLAPANTPAVIITALNEALAGIVATEKMQDELQFLGYTSASSDAEEFKEIIHHDIDRFSELTARIGLEAN